MAIRSLPSKVKSVSGTMCCENCCKVQFSLVFHSVFSKSGFFFFMISNFFHQFIFFLESILKCPVQLQCKICCVSRTNQRCSLSSQLMITEAADDVRRARWLVVAASHPAGLKIATCVFISYLFVVQVLFLNVEEEPAQKQQYYFSKPQTRGPGQNRAVKKRQRTDTR